MAEEFKIVITGQGINIERTIDQAYAARIMALLADHVSGLPIEQAISSSISQGVPDKSSGKSKSSSRQHARQTKKPSIVKELDLSGGGENQV